MLAYILDPSLKSCEIFSKLFPLSQPQWRVYKTENSTYLRGLWGRAVIKPHGAHSPVAAHRKCQLLLLQLLTLLLWYQTITESQPSIRERWKHHFFAVSWTKGQIWVMWLSACPGPHSQPSQWAQSTSRLPHCKEASCFTLEELNSKLKCLTYLAYC